jgi:hypothetical protein
MDGTHGLRRRAVTTHAAPAVGFGAWPYFVVGLLIRLMTFTITYETMVVTTTVETNQTSNQVMLPILHLTGGGFNARGYGTGGWAVSHGRANPCSAARRNHATA